MEAKRVLMSLLFLLITAKVTCEDCVVLRREDKLKIYLKGCQDGLSHNSLRKDLTLVLSTHVKQLTTTYNLASRDPMASSGFHEYPRA